MALSTPPVTLTKGFWKKISTVGQSGSAWRHAMDKGSIIKIAHSDQAQTPNDNIPHGIETGFSVDASYSLPEIGISDVLEADNGNDIFYATLVNGITGATAKIITDFI